MGADVVTAGAFILYKGAFLFQFGPDQSGERLGIVRVGGHREAGEVPWACAAREALEEAFVRIEHVQPPATFRLLEMERLEPLDWSLAEPAPLLVVTGAGLTPRSYLYLARTDDLPHPAAETQGLMLLSPGEVRWLVREQVTLGKFLDAGGRVTLQSPIPRHMALASGYHLQVFARMLELFPHAGFLNGSKW